MHKILPTILILSIFVGCSSSDDTDPQLFEVGQKVCLLGKTLPFEVGEICGFEKGEINFGELYKNDIYHISVYKPELKGNIILKKKVQDILEFIGDEEE